MVEPLAEDLGLPKANSMIGQQYCRQLGWGRKIVGEHSLLGRA